MPDTDGPTNLLLQTMPDRGPGRTVMGLVASSVAITTTAATYLLGASHHVWGAGVLLSGLALGVVLFLYFRSYILDEQCFTANLPFELKAEHAQEAARLMNATREACAATLVYIMSFPLTRKGRVLGVLNINFCYKTSPADGSPPGDAD